MNIKQAKEIPIESFLDKVGHQPTSIKNDDVWYLSPFRDEKTASFVVSRKLNKWHDLGGAGAEKSGDLVDCVRLMFGGSVSDALKRLSADFPCVEAHQKPRPPRFAAKEQPKKSLELVTAERISKPALHCYLRDRGINPDIAKQYLKQVNFTVGNNPKTQYALGFANDVGGYEVRSSIFKGFVGTTKTLTSINLEAGRKVVVFEGFFDFLSFLTHQQIQDLKSSAIILNSTTQDRKAKEILSSIPFEKAYFFLDNDVTGRKTRDFLAQNLPYPTTDKSSIYKNFKDYNDLIMNKNADAH